MDKAAHGIWYVLVMAGLLTLVGVPSAIAAPAGTSAAEAGEPAGRRARAAAPASDDFTARLIDSLAQSGFQVSQGRPRLYTLKECVEHTYPSLKNCFLANPAAPYVVPVLRSWPDEYLDPALKDAVLATEPGFTATYRLDPREAIVIYGQMPPPGRYLGLQTWQFSASGKWKAKDYAKWAKTPDLPFPMQYLFDTIPPEDANAERLISLSALGDVVNNVVMERKSGYPFGEIRYFIITPSATTEEAVRGALRAQGVRDDHIFTEQIPSGDEHGPIGPLGMGKDAIDFFTALRYAVPEPGHQADAEAWRKDLPLRVLRVRAPASLGPERPYGSLVFEPRTAKSEADDLAGDLQALVAALCARLETDLNLGSTDCKTPPPATSFIPELVRDYGWTGPYCREVGMNCQADQQEAALYFSSPRALDAGQVIAVVGTLATETGNATYVGLSANDASMMAGVSNVLDTDVVIPGKGTIKGLKGSADVFAGSVKNTGKFFVHFFASDCSVLGAAWVERCSPTAGVQPAIGDPALRGKFIFALRDYIAIGTQRGPDPSKLLTPRIFTFTKSQP